MKRKIFMIILAVALSVNVFAEDASKATIQINGKRMTLNEAIGIVLENNLSLQSAKYDLLMTDTSLMKFEQKYGWQAGVDSGYASQVNPASSMSAYTGTEQWQWDATLSMSKMFSTGTMISAGLKEVYSDANDTGVGVKGYTGYVAPSPAFHKPNIFVNIQQEMLKNAFGRNDRLQEKMLQNAALMQKDALLYQLSGLVVSAIVDYWNVTVQKSSLDNSILQLKATKDVRDVIARNTQFGLAESYDLNQYNALLASAETRYALAEQNYKEGVRKMKATLNLPDDTDLSGIAELVATPPVLNTESDLALAYNKRVDYLNSLRTLENAKAELKLYSNTSLPSLIFSAGLTTQGQDNSFGTAVKDTVAFTYPGWQVRAKLTYPLDDKDQEVNLRNAEIKFKQAEVALDKSKVDIKNEISNRSERVKLQYDILQKSITARQQSDLYYDRLFVKFKQGKVNSVAMKLATDSMIQARQQELESLINYNIVMLQYDLTKNVVFEKYGIDVNRYLAPKKEK